MSLANVDSTPADGMNLITALGEFQDLCLMNPPGTFPFSVTMQIFLRTGFDEHPITREPSVANLKMIKAPTLQIPTAPLVILRLFELQVMVSHSSHIALGA